MSPLRRSALGLGLGLAVACGGHDPTATQVGMGEEILDQTAEDGDIDCEDALEECIENPPPPDACLLRPVP